MVSILILPESYCDLHISFIIFTGCPAVCVNSVWFVAHLSGCCWLVHRGRGRCRGCFRVQFWSCAWREVSSYWLPADFQQMISFGWTIVLKLWQAALLYIYECLLNFLNYQWINYCQKRKQLETCAFTVSMYLDVCGGFLSRESEQSDLASPDLKKHTQNQIQWGKMACDWLSVFHFLHSLTTEGKHLCKHFIIHDHECK